MTIYYNYFTSPIGTIYMAFSPKGICRISFNKQREEGFCQKLRNRFKANITLDPGLGKEVKNDILSYLAGEKKIFAEYELDTSQGTYFHRQVWGEVKKITYGQTRSYQRIARQIGSPNAQRAVGQANGNNPIPLIIPCHRVVCSNGKLGGYSEGVHIKKELLELERLNTGTEEEKRL
jgi:methylated-DNA-[protein]-cysteine S-methyltransferase